VGFLMDLVAGDSKAIVLAITVDDWASFADRERFDAHIALGGGMDPTWLDRFSEAVRSVSESDEPMDFIDARRELEGPADVGERTVERIDPSWVAAVARVRDHDIDALAGRWIELIEEELGALPREEKPWIREVAGRLVEFARRSELSSSVLLAWSL
jgi:hypothetical protein